MQTALESLLVPPGINFALLVLGLLLLPLFKKLGLSFIELSIFTLYLLSTPYFASILMNSLNKYPTLDLEKLDPNQKAQAIVVLSGSNKYAPELGGVTVSGVSFMRESYAAKLYEKTKLPIYISGGKPSLPGKAEAEVMAMDLTKTFNIPTTWLETKSTNTYENGHNLKERLDQDKIKTFYLVTSSWHMRRAMWVFTKLGFHPIPAPTDFEINPHSASVWQNWLPDNASLFLSNKAMREYEGLLWYQIHYHKSS